MVQIVDRASAEEASPTTLGAKLKHLFNGKRREQPELSLILIKTATPEPSLRREWLTTRISYNPS